MDDLSKHQLILVALLVSFVTSLATGIVTVSLMDQAPQGVVHTISQVIEKEMVPQDASVGSSIPVTFVDQTATAVGAASQSIAKLRDRSNGTFAGLGLVMTSSGVILADKSTVAQMSAYEAVLSSGVAVPLYLVQAQNDGEVAFLAPSIRVASTTEFVPIAYADAPALGQTVFSLSGTSTLMLGQGAIASSDYQSDSPSVTTTTSGDDRALGGPLFDIHGNVIGFRTTNSYYPVSKLKAVVPVIH